jgi:hypothetical protein
MVSAAGQGCGGVPASARRRSASTTVGPRGSGPVRTRAAWESSHGCVWQLRSAHLGGGAGDDRGKVDPGGQSAVRLAVVAAEPGGAEGVGDGGMAVPHQQ